MALPEDSRWTGLPLRFPASGSATSAVGSPHSPHFYPASVSPQLATKHQGLPLAVSFRLRQAGKPKSPGTSTRLPCWLVCLYCLRVAESTEISLKATASIEDLILLHSCFCSSVSFLPTSTSNSHPLTHTMAVADVSGKHDIPAPEHQSVSAPGEIGTSGANADTAIVMPFLRQASMTLPSSQWRPQRPLTSGAPDSRRLSTART